MNPSNAYDSASDVPWPTSDHRVRVPGTSMLPDRDKAAPAIASHDTRRAWAEGMRTTVRSNPLACVAAALALGAVIARLTR